MRKQAPRRNTSSGGRRKGAEGAPGARRGRPSGRREDSAPGERGAKRSYGADKPWKKRGEEDRSAGREERRPARGGRFSGGGTEGTGRERGRKPYSSSGPERRSNNRYATDKPWKRREGEEGAGDESRRPSSGNRRFSGRGEDSGRGRKPYGAGRKGAGAFGADKPWKKRPGDDIRAEKEDKRSAYERRVSRKTRESGEEPEEKRPYTRRSAAPQEGARPWKKRDADDSTEKPDSRRQSDRKGAKSWEGQERDARKRPASRGTYERRDTPKFEEGGRRTRETGEGSEEKRPYTRRSAAPQEGARPWKKRDADDGAEKPASRTSGRGQADRKGAKSWEGQEHDARKRPASRGTYERREAPKFEEGRRTRPERSEKPGRVRSEKPESSRSLDEKTYVKKKNYGDKKSPAGASRTYAERGRKEEKLPEITEDIRLNKFLANAGLCSRREADTFIQSGVVTVNGVAITEMGYKVKPGDEIKFGGRAVRREKSVYILMNKAKDHITTTDDPEGRKTVMELLKDGPKERVFPVGRLDRNTTGILLFTNDGDLAERLMHPRYNIKKVYLAVLDKRLARGHMEELMQGIELEDGPIKADDIAYIGEDKKNIGIEIHSGRNRIIHRMFEHLDYKVDKLDRTSYAGLSKKELKRGEWRHLHDDELWALKKLVKLI